ncbi:MAG: hypothetical protein RR891_06225 [Clostridium sp.]
MANFFRNNIGIGYLKISFMEIVKYSHNGFPICDECSKDLIGYEDIILIPILNQAYCSECGKSVLKRIKDYPEDRDCRRHREEFWKSYFNIKEEIQDVI